MAKLIYSMILSLDGYIEDADGRFGWAAPDEEVHSYVNELGSSTGTYLYGRRMYETMVFGETAHTIPDEPQVVLDWARQWQAAGKVVIRSGFSPRVLGILRLVAGIGYLASASTTLLLPQYADAVSQVAGGGGPPIWGAPVHPLARDLERKASVTHHPGRDAGGRVARR